MRVSKPMGWSWMALSLSIVSLSAESRAELEFPGALQEAAGMECIPTCLMCHTSNPGRADTWAERTLAVDLVSIKDAQGTPVLKLKAADTEGLKRAYQAYAAQHPAEAAKIRQGIQPQTGQDVCSPSYGCGASVAPTRVTAGGALLSGLLTAAAALWLARRRR